MSTVYPISGILSGYFNLSSTSRPPEEIWHKATWGGSKENPFIIPSVCGVGEINKSARAGFIYILLCEPNTLTWGKEDEWVVWG